MSSTLDEVFQNIKVVQNFPKDGIMFRHIGPLLANTKLFKFAIEKMYAMSNYEKYDVVCGLDARGFIMSTAIQYLTGIPQVMIRKQSKLPGKKYTYEYQKEYGTDVMELEIDCIKRGQKVLIVDDLMATAGTLVAAANLIEQAGGIVSGIMVLISFNDLGGRLKLKNLYPNCGIHSLFSLGSDDCTKCLTKLFVMPEVTTKKNINVYVASKNLNKLTAVHESIVQAFPKSYNYTIYSVDCVSSGVPEQPFGYDEICRGSMNRLNNCVDIVGPSNGLNESIFFSIENGILKHEGFYYDVPVINIMLTCSTIVTIVGNNEALMIPSRYEYYVVESLNSVDRSITFGSIFKREHEIEDWHEYVSEISRKNYLKKAICSHNFNF